MLKDNRLDNYTYIDVVLWIRIGFIADMDPDPDFLSMQIQIRILILVRLLSQKRLNFTFEKIYSK
jgi:hypothetical protein